MTKNFEITEESTCVLYQKFTKNYPIKYYFQLSPDISHSFSFKVKHISAPMLNMSLDGILINFFLK